ITLILFIPLVGAVVTGLLPSRWSRAPRWCALVFSGAALAASVALAIGFNPGVPGLQFVQKASWVPSIGVQFFVGVDGLNLPLLVLNTLLTFVAVLGSWPIDRRTRLYFAR